mgnify:CR=1 FL=1
MLLHSHWVAQFNGFLFYSNTRAYRWANDRLFSVVWFWNYIRNIKTKRTTRFKKGVPGFWRTCHLPGNNSIGDKMKDGGWVFEVLSAITWGMIYFYVANWTKNLKRLFPSSRGISFIHYILGLEILKNLPLLKNFVDKNPENEQQSPSNN